MKGVAKAWVIPLSMALVLSSCLNLSRPASRIETYTLEYAAPVPAGDYSLPWVIRVERFTAAPEYNSTQMVYREEAFRREAYAFHRWRAHPGDLAAYFLARDIRHAGLLRAVLPEESALSSSHTLEGAVDEFLEWDREDRWMARLAITLTLVADHEPDITKRVLMQKTYSQEEECGAKNPRALVEAMGRAMAKISRRVIADLHERLRGKGSERP